MRTERYTVKKITDLLISRVISEKHGGHLESKTFIPAKAIFCPMLVNLKNNTAISVYSRPQNPS